LLQIDLEQADITCLHISNMSAVRHLGFVIRQFWTTHEVPLTSFIFAANGITIRSVVTETLRFCVFGSLVGKCLFAPLLEQCLRHNREIKGWSIIEPQQTRYHFSGFLPSVPLFVKINPEMRPWECGQTYRQTNRQTLAQMQRHKHAKTISQSVPCCAMGQLGLIAMLNQFQAYQLSTISSCHFTVNFPNQWHTVTQSKVIPWELVTC